MTIQRHGEQQKHKEKFANIISLEVS